MTLGQYVALSVILISIAMAGALAYDGLFWASSSQAVPVALAGGAMGLINALGNLGGFAGPYVGGWLQDASGGSLTHNGTVLGGSGARAVALLPGMIPMWVDRKMHLLVTICNGSDVMGGIGASRTARCRQRLRRHRSARSCVRSLRPGRRGSGPCYGRQR